MMTVLSDGNGSKQASKREWGHCITAARVAFCLSKKGKALELVSLLNGMLYY